MAYLYRHIRLDKNEPFYIGISNIDDDYRRAFDKIKRNIYWRRIANKTEIEVDILFDNISWDNACEKEIEFIKLYGRKDLKTGTLVNCTGGGQELMNFSEEVLRKKSEVSRKNELGRKHPEWRNKIKSLAQGGENHWAYGIKMKQDVVLKKSNSMKERYINGYVHPMLGYKMSEERLLKHRKCSMKPISQYTKDGIFIRDWDCAKDVEIEIGICASNVGRSMNTKGYTAGGFIWGVQNNRIVWLFMYSILMEQSLMKDYKNWL